MINNSFHVSKDGQHISSHDSLDDAKAAISSMLD
jgi:hypothetical protein